MGNPINAVSEAITSTDTVAKASSVGMRSFPYTANATWYRAGFWCIGWLGLLGSALKYRLGFCTSCTPLCRAK